VLAYTSTVFVTIIIRCVLQLECKNDKDGKFRGQTLFDRNMSVKMDRLANMEEKKPALPGILLGYTFSVS